jgi:hypothetical protein
MPPDQLFDFQPPSQTASAARASAPSGLGQSTSSTAQQAVAKDEAHKTTGSQADTSPQPDVELYGDGKPHFVTINAKVIQK